jgi:hypothetical protein
VWRSCGRGFSEAERGEADLLTRRGICGILRARDMCGGSERSNRDQIDHYRSSIDGIVDYKQW